MTYPFSVQRKSRVAIGPDRAKSAGSPSGVGSKKVSMRRAAELAGIVTAALALAGPAHAAGEAIELRGTGAQVYTCEASPSGFGWRLKAPEATLLDDAGTEFGRHFTGPSWQARDGSTVVGEVVASNPAPQPGSIPWLLLRAKSHSGSGALASVGYIARIRTEGGLAPANGCDATHIGAERRVPYSAFYVFFSD
ncbi:MAG: hypothetical protein JWL84_668 [Rhodospirillales bacterium]|jgi:hypothetical protein|nr:hypothetical protein [Rhodospirillales bacterium]